MLPLSVPSPPPIACDTTTCLPKRRLPSCRWQLVLLTLTAVLLGTTGPFRTVSSAAKLSADEAVRRPATAVTAGPLTVEREQWRLIYVGGNPIGFMRGTLSSRAADGRKIYLNSQLVAVTVPLPQRTSGFGGPSAVRTKIIMQTEETETGEILAFSHEVPFPPTVATHRLGRIIDGVLKMETTTRGRVSSSEIPWQATIKGPAYADRMLLENPLKPQETRTVVTFDPKTAKVDTIRFEASDLENTLLLSGSEKKLLHVISTHSVAPGVLFHEFLDDKGESWKTTIPSSDMIIHTVSKATVLKTFPDAETE